MLHEPRQRTSWLIFDVGQKIKSTTAYEDHCSQMRNKCSAETCPWARSHVPFHGDCYLPLSTAPDYSTAPQCEFRIPRWYRSYAGACIPLLGRTLCSHQSDHIAQVKQSYRCINDFTAGMHPRRNQPQNAQQGARANADICHAACILTGHEIETVEY
jgi:hypothetical protein